MTTSTSPSTSRYAASLGAPWRIRCSSAPITTREPQLKRLSRACLDSWPSNALLLANSKNFRFSTPSVDIQFDSQPVQVCRSRICSRNCRQSLQLSMVECCLCAPRARLASEGQIAELADEVHSGVAIGDPNRPLPKARPEVAAVRVFGDRPMRGLFRSRDGFASAVAIRQLHERCRLRSVAAGRPFQTVKIGIASTRAFAASEISGRYGDSINPPSATRAISLLDLTAWQKAMV